MDLEQANAAHAEWKIKLRTAINSRDTVDAAGIAADDRCPLGKWLKTEGRASLGALPEFTECLNRHAEFHREAGKVAQAVNQRRYDEAEAMLGADTAYTAATRAVATAILSLRKKATA